MDGRAAAEPPGAPPRGVLLDLWNTLVFTDRSPNPIAALADAFGLTGPGGLACVERAIMTRPLAGITEALDALASFTGRRPCAAARRDMVMQWGAACNLNRIYPDVIPALRALRLGPRRARVGIVSNTQSFDLDILRRDGLDTMMDALSLSCHTGLLKPDAAAFRDAASRLGLPAAAIVMVGDRLEEDVLGAMNAGMRAVWLERSGRAATTIAVPVIRSLADLPALISGETLSGGSGPA